MLESSRKVVGPRRLESQVEGHCFPKTTPRVQDARREMSKALPDLELV